MIRVLPLLLLMLCACESVSAQDFPPPGALVDIGGRKLHLDCKGSGAGPTVLIEAGAVAAALHYRKAQEAIAPLARVCAYDRAGAGWSDPAPAGRTLEDRAADLHALLRASGEKPPYILVGHSMGGFVVRLFARDHREDVTGIALIESSEEKLVLSADYRKNDARTKSQLEMAARAAASGMLPAIMATTGMFKAPPDAPSDFAITFTANALRAGADDMNAMMIVPDAMAKAAGFGTLGDLPLVVVTRGRADDPPTPDEDRRIREAHERLAALSSNSLLLVAEKSRHNVHYDQPGIFAEAVKLLLEANKSSKQLVRPGVP
jgi:pimeloyl-ACP methyl ester carboxylesterase